MNVEIYPLDKVVIDGVSVHFGMSKAEVESLIGAGSFVNTRFIKNRCYYHNNEMSIDYDEALRVRGVEFLGGIDGEIKPLIYGMSAFDSDAEVILSVLREKNGREQEDTERGYSYSFHGISIGVYREITSSDVAEMIEEMKENGIPTENNPDLERDKLRANRWAAICAGDAGYYKR